MRKARQAVSAFNPRGMRSGFALAGFTDLRGWAYKDVTQLRQRITKIQRAGLYDQLLFYYLDNEKSFEGWQNLHDVIATVKAQDRDRSGRRRHPIYALQGQYGTARMYANRQVQFTDMVGAYFGEDALLTLQNIEGQTNPVVFAQINHRNEMPNFRFRVYNALIRGAKGLGYYRDFYGVTRRGKIQGRQVEEVEWWPDLPNLRREIEQLLPLLRQPHWTPWKLTPNPAHKTLAMGTRAYRGEGYVLLANRKKTPVTVTFTLQHFPYKPKAVYDYFSGKNVTTVSQDAFTVTLPGQGIGTGTAVYRLASDATEASALSSPANWRTMKK